MIASIALYALLAAQSTKTSNQSSPAKSKSLSCAAAYLGRLVSPTGAPDSWVLSKAKYSAIEKLPREKISDSGTTLDGYSHWLYLAKDKQTVYVVQIGGIAGTRHVYGPFPAAQCKANNG
ncbi:MAG: hypothetical protein JSS25_01080 [Proteobacteria bacterium]|nr:hypothetical protein [Pseudomonadota bacterium]